MTDLAKTNGGGLLGVLHGESALDIPVPFQREIFLFETHVAGTTHIPHIEQLEESIQIDDRFEFFREVDNAQDGRAIVIKTASGEKIGYVPQRDNVIFARLMDAGKLLFGKVSSKEMKGTWLRIGLKIYLTD